MELLKIAVQLKEYRNIIRIDPFLNIDDLKELNVFC